MKNYQLVVMFWDWLCHKPWSFRIPGHFHQSVDDSWFMDICELIELCRCSIIPIFKFSNQYFLFFVPEGWQVLCFWWFYLGVLVLDQKSLMSKFRRCLLGIQGRLYPGNNLGQLEDPWRIHDRSMGRTVYLPIHGWLILMVNVVKYTGPMDSMGLHSLKLTVRTWKWMVGIRSFPFGMANFQVQAVSLPECNKS